MSKKEHKVYDINGIQICVGDKVACAQKQWRGAPAYHVKMGKVRKITATGFNYDYIKSTGRVEDEKYKQSCKWSDKTAVVIEGEFILKNNGDSN